MINILIKKRRRGQAAIEFLVTYGWAIMAAMIVIGALTYFGITNPSTSLPDKCIFANAFECKDFQINTTALRLKVINTQGETIYGNATGIAAYMTDNNVACVVTGSPKTYLDPEAELEVTCNNPPDSPFNSKEKAKVRVTISYLKSPDVTAYKQVSLGEVYSTVQ